MITVQFTKTFVSGSLLDGIAYDEVIEITGINGLASEQERANELVSFLKRHTSKPVKPCAGSAYIVSNINMS